MKQIKTILLAATVALLFTSIGACKKDEKKSNQRTFSIAKFKQNLKNQLPTGIVGYSVVIGNNGVFADSIQHGFAKISVSSGTTTPLTMNTYINIASVTKTLTAIAAIKLLDKNGISLDSTIKNYLPAYWNTVAAVQNLTFKELLSQRSGIRQNSTSYDSLKFVCTNGLNGPKGTLFYSNANFALFRVMLPYINNMFDTKLNESTAVSNNSTAAFEATLSQRYIAIMQTEVFTPAGIANATCNRYAITQTVSSCFSEGANTQVDDLTGGDWTEVSGGGGYYLTTFQLAQIMTYLNHTTQLLSASQRSDMNANLYGLDPEDSPTTTAGRGYGKDGALQWGAPGLQTYVCSYPNKVQVTICVNSISGGTFRNLATLALNAYENSWD